MLMGSEACLAISSGRGMALRLLRDSLDSRDGAWFMAKLSAVSTTSSRAAGACRGLLKSETFLPVTCVGTDTPSAPSLFWMMAELFGNHLSIQTVTHVWAKAGA